MYNHDVQLLDNVISVVNLHQLLNIPNNITLQKTYFIISLFLFYFFVWIREWQVRVEKDLKKEFGYY